MNGPGSPVDSSEKEMEKGTLERKSIEDIAENAGNASTGNGAGKGPKKTFRFTKMNTKAKGVSKGADGQMEEETKNSRKDAAGKSAKSKSKSNFFEKYKNFCFRFGIYFDKNPQPDLAKSLYQADVEITPGMFISLTIVTSLLVSTLMLLFCIVMFYGMPNDLVYIFSLTFLTFGLSLGGFPFSLYNKVSNKNMNIQYEIPFALSYMSVLASGDAEPLEIIRRVATEDYGDISKEFSKVVFRIDILGEDANSAMSHLIQNTSSEQLRAVCIDISNAMQAGGGLQTYLEMKTKELMDMRREAQKLFIDSLSIFGEGYLSGIVMSVVLVVLMIVICSALGLDLKIMTPHQLFNFFVYFALPFINLMFLLMLWMKYSRSAV